VSLSLLSSCLAISVVVGRCGHDGNPSAAAGAKKHYSDTLVGRVLSEPPPAGQVGIERWRFQPDNCPDHYLRLTRIPMQAAQTPESQEIQLDPYAGKKIKLKYQRVDPTWVWGAEAVEIVSE
jgi:hypothetical protein